MNLRDVYDLDLNKTKDTTSEVAKKIGKSRQAVYSRLDSNASFENVCEIWAAMGIEIWKMAYDTDGKKRLKPFYSSFDQDIELKVEAENIARRKQRMRRSR